MPGGCGKTRICSIANAQLQDLTAELAEINAACANIEASLEDENPGLSISYGGHQLHNEIQSIGTCRDSLKGQKVG